MEENKLPPNTSFTTTLPPYSLTSVSSMKVKTTSGAAAVPKTSVLILSLGFALWYRVACICLHISLADAVLLSKAVHKRNNIETTTTNWIELRNHETKIAKQIFQRFHWVKDSRLNRMSTCLTYRKSLELVSLVNLIGMLWAFYEQNASICFGAFVVFVCGSVWIAKQCVSGLTFFG